MDTENLNQPEGMIAPKGGDVLVIIPRFLTTAQAVANLADNFRPVGSMRGEV